MKKNTTAKQLATLRQFHRWPKSADVVRCPYSYISEDLHDQTIEYLSDIRRKIGTNRSVSGDTLYKYY